MLATEERYGFDLVKALGEVVRLAASAIDEDAELACLLVGARDAFVAQSGMAIEPFSIKQRDQTLKTAEKQLGATKTAETLACGERLSVLEAVDLALERIQPVPHAPPLRG